MEHSLKGFFLIHEVTISFSLPELTIPAIGTMSVITSMVYIKVVQQMCQHVQ